MLYTHKEKLYVILSLFTIIIVCNYCASITQGKIKSVIHIPLINLFSHDIINIFKNIFIIAKYLCSIQIGFLFHCLQVHRDDTSWTTLQQAEIAHHQSRTAELHCPHGTACQDQ